MQVLGEVLQGVPLFQDGEILHPVEPGELGRSDFHGRLLLAAVDDELAAEHGDVGIEVRLDLVGPALGVEGVGGGMEADEALAVGHGVQELLLAGRGHRGKPSIDLGVHRLPQV